MDRRIFWLLSAGVVLLAYVLRDLYVTQGIVVEAFSGDAWNYAKYADHMLKGYFGSGAIPDAYRPPGYPALLALSQLPGGDAYHRLLQWQVALGAATVGFTIALGRQWLPRWAALLAGLLLALWPHHIAFTAEVLSEVLYGFLLSAALLVAALAKDRAWAWACAGLLFACATMVNSVCALLPIVAGIALIGRQSPARWVALLAPVVVIVGGWSMRPVDGGMDRAWQNLVQGSHPMYHQAFGSRIRDPKMGAITKAIEAEAANMVADPAQGLRTMASRLAEHPGQTLGWYAYKPWLLWAWDVRISAVHGPYMHKVKGSLLEASPLREVSAVLRALNPVFFGLSLLFAIHALFRPGPARMIGLAFLYVTVVHVVLQAEPRFSIPYRSLELLLAMSGLLLICGWIRRRSAPAAHP